MQIDGKIAMVTGGGSGLGAATARALAANGAKVAIFDLDRPAAEAVASEIGGLALEGNAASESDVGNALQAIDDTLGPVRVLVNCAGIGGARRIVGREGPHPLDDFRKVVEVNLVGTFNTIRLFAARAQEHEPLADGERGVIVNTASVAAFEGQIGQSAYAATKGGIVAMTLPIARDLSRAGIRVMTIAPGLFKTPLLAELPEEAQQSLGAQTPFPSRLGDPAEFAALACHIIENRMLNGEVIRLDGAIRMAPR